MAGRERELEAMQPSKLQEEEPEVATGPKTGPAGESASKSGSLELDSPMVGIKEEAAGDTSYASSIDAMYPDPPDSFPGRLFPGSGSFDWSSPDSSSEGRNNVGGVEGQEAYEETASRPGTSRIPGKDHRRFYHNDWRLEYLMDFNARSHSMICMVCGSSLATLKLSTIKRHICQKHPYSLNWTPCEKEIIIGSWDAHLCVDAQTLAGSEEHVAESMKARTVPKKKRRRLPPVAKGTWQPLLGPELSLTSRLDRTHLEQYMNESLQQWFRLQFVMDYDYQGSKLHCMMCTTTLSSLSLTDIKHHILDNHPTSLQLSPTQKSVILDAWINRKESPNMEEDMTKNMEEDMTPDVEVEEDLEDDYEETEKLAVKKARGDQVAQKTTKSRPENKMLKAKSFGDLMEKDIKSVQHLGGENNNSCRAQPMEEENLEPTDLEVLEEEEPTTEDIQLLDNKEWKSKEVHMLADEEWKARKKPLLESERQTRELQILQEPEKIKKEEKGQFMEEEKRKTEESHLLKEEQKTRERQLLEEQEKTRETTLLEQENQKAIDPQLLEEEKRKAKEEVQLLKKEKRKAKETQLLEEEKRKPKEAKLLEEEKGKAKEAQLLKEEKNVAQEVQLLEEEKRKAKEAQLIEEENKRAKEAQLLEEDEKKAMEAQLLEEEQKKAKEAQLLEEEQKKAKEAQLLEEERKKAKEAQLLEEEKKKAKEAQLQEEEKKAKEAQLLEEEKKKAKEAQLLEEEKKKAKEAQLLEEEKKKAKEAQLQEEEQKKAKEVQLLEEEKKKAKEAQLLEEEKKAAKEAQLLEEEKKKAKEAQLLEEEKKKAKEAQLLEEKKKKAKEAQLQEEEQKKAKEAQLLEEEKKKAKEAQLQEEEKKKAKVAQLLEEERSKTRDAQLLIEQRIEVGKTLQQEKPKAQERKVKEPQVLSKEVQSCAGEIIVKLEDHQYSELTKNEKKEGQTANHVQAEKQHLHLNLVEGARTQPNEPGKHIIQVQQVQHAPTVLGIGLPVLKMETPTPLIITRVSVMPEHTILQTSKPKPSTSASDISKTWRVIAPKVSPPDIQSQIPPPTSTEPSQSPAGVDSTVWEVSVWRGNSGSLVQNNAYQMRWRSEYLMDFNGVRGTVVCMYCSSSLTILKESSIRRHIIQKHPHTGTFGAEEKAAIILDWENKLSELKRMSAKPIKDGVIIGDQGLSIVKVPDCDPVEPEEEESSWSGVLPEGKGASWEFAFGRLEAKVKDPRKYQHDRWKLEFLMDYTPAKDGLICMVCGATLMNPKISTVKMHIQQKHPDTTYLSDQEKAVVMEEWEQKMVAGKKAAGQQQGNDEICIEINEDSTTSETNGSSVADSSPCPEIILPTFSKTPKSTPSLPPPCNSAKRNYQVRWRTEFMMDYDCRREGLICMVCGGTLATLKVSTIKRHIVQVHPYSVDFTIEERHRILDAYSEMALHYIHSEECFKTQPQEEVKGRKRKATSVEESLISQ